MSIRKSSFVALLLSFSLLLLTSCSFFDPPKKAKLKGTAAAIAEADDPPLPPGPVAKTDKGDPSDPIGSDPALPTGPTVRETDPKVKFDPFKIKDPKVPKGTYEGPVAPKIDEPADVREHVLPPLPVPKAGVAEPTFKPEIVTLTYVGGRGKQWVQEVGFTEDGRIYAKGGGDTFTIYYSADGGKRLEIVGDINKTCTGPRGLSNRASTFRALCPTSKVKLEIGSESYGNNKLQPYLKSSFDWHWWGWPAAEMAKGGMEASSRGVNVHYLHDDRFLAKVFVDSGKTTVAKDPKDLKKANPVLGTGALGDPGGPGTLYMVGNGKNGRPEVGTFVKGKAMAEAIDPWERLYIALPWEGRGLDDKFKLSGTSGFCILNANLTTPLFSTTMGADNIYCMALKDNILVLGGNIGQEFEADPKKVVKNIPPAKLPVKNPAQELPGGDEDGFLAIIKLW
jgi:hypothetical protein